MANEPYWTRYSANGKAAREALSDSHREALQKIEDDLSENPDQYSKYTIELSTGIYLYKHPNPEIQLTYKIDDKQQTIEYLHVVAPLTEVSKPLFISYSHKDEEWLLQLKKFLIPLEKKELIKIWDDHQIQAGTAWEDEIKRELSGAKAALLLVSQDFLTSEFIAEKELPYLLEAAKNKELTILWVAVRPSTVDDTELKDYQALHKNPPLNSLDDAGRDKAYLQIYERIKAVVANA